MATTKMTTPSASIRQLFLGTIVFMATRIREGRAQEAEPSAEVTSSGYGPGSMAAAVILTFLCTLLLSAALFYFWKKRSDAKKGSHLILETDPERGGKAEYAFDNPGFKDATIIATSEKFTKNENANKTKWGHWSPLSALKLKPEKKRPLDDSAIQNHEVKVVALKSQDFTGLGFNICGNMKEGIYIKDILHRGPAFESGKLNPGDRINSVTISFEHMVYEDALNILSYASPYEVIIEAKSGRLVPFSQGQGQTPVHPIYRSSSAVDLTNPEKSSKKKLFGDDYSSSSNYSSLQKSRSNVTTLERKESKSPRPIPPKSRKPDRSPQKLTPEMVKTHLEQTITEDHMRMRDEAQRIDAQLQRASAETKGQKFGIRVLPMDNQQKSPKILETNQNNMNIERYNMEELPIRSIDEVDVITRAQPPQARKREKKSPEPAFDRNGSGIRRDLNGIPLEIPDHMQDAALMAKRNRKSSNDHVLVTNGEDVSRKSKGKAPSPPPPAEVKVNFTLGGGKTRAFEDLSTLGTNDSSSMEHFGSDSEDDANNMSSVNTIELNSSDITIHQIEEEERKSRKTASTGDLTKMKKAPRSNSGTLERAQSLDITDTSSPGLSRKRNFDAMANLLIDRAPRLSLVLDGLTNFQRDRLKTSTEWGNLEDAIQNFDDADWEQRRKSESQFNAVMDRVMQIKRESQEIEILPDEVVRQYQAASALQESSNGPKITNKIWPDEEELVNGVKFENSGWKRLNTQEELTKRSLEVDVEPSVYTRRQQVPPVPERTKLRSNEAPAPEEPKRNEDLKVSTFEEKHEKESVEKPQPTERVSKIDLILNTTTTASPKKESNKPSPSGASLFNQPNTKLSVEYECIKPMPPKRDRTPEKEIVINLTQNIIPPVTSFEKNNITEICSQIAKGRQGEGEMIKDEWEVTDTLNNTSPPPSMTLVDEVMDSYNKNYGTNAVTVVQTGEPSETPVISPAEASSMSSNLPDENKSVGNMKSATANFLFNERSMLVSDTNVPDDVKVSRGSYESLEAKKVELVPPPKSDDAKSEDLLVTHVTVTENGTSNLHSLELSINNEPSELYTTAIDGSANVSNAEITISDKTQQDVTTVIVSRPNQVTIRKTETTSISNDEPLVEITESSFSKVTKAPERIPVNVSESKPLKIGEGSHQSDYKVEITESRYSTFEVDKPHLPLFSKATMHLEEPSIEDGAKEVVVESLSSGFKGIEDESPAISLTDVKGDDLDINTLSQDVVESDSDKKTYVTEIQVLTPSTTETTTTVSNVAEAKIAAQINDDPLENAFENYVKNFERKLETFESNMQNFENNLEEFVRDEPKSIVLEEKSDVEKQASKIKEIAEEQLKTLPEMRFSTSSYESGGRKTPEKRHSFELLRSNFEKTTSDKSPPRRDSASTTPTKSRIPISTTMKTPPMSPERRDSRNLDNENDKAILELMSSSSIHSSPTPFTSKIKPPSTVTKNVSVTSIRSNSKIPSGLPTLSSRPPIPPKKSEDHGGLLQVSTNGGMESSFKQWVFNPNSNVTNVTVGKEK